jgi:hypothetical protein
MENYTTTEDFKDLEFIKQLDKEFDIIIDIIDEINHDQKSIIKIKLSKELTKEYDCSSLEGLRKLYIDNPITEDYDFEDRIESFLNYFIENYTLCRSMANLVHQQYLLNINN